MGTSLISKRGDFQRAHQLIQGNAPQLSQLGQIVEALRDQLLNLVHQRHQFGVFFIRKGVVAGFGRKPGTPLLYIRGHNALIDGNLASASDRCGYRPRVFSPTCLPNDSRKRR